jgi:hypothetical protein
MKSHLVAVAAAVIAVSSALMVHHSADAAAPNASYIGEVFISPFGFCPNGSYPAQGGLLPISQNTALFSLMGTKYGGDGQNNFALPNMAPIPVGNGPAAQYCISAMGIWPNMSTQPPPVIIRHPIPLAH